MKLLPWLSRFPPRLLVWMPVFGNLGTSAAEQDAAMAWLESLAAKQGAKAEELITNPEDRLEKPPEWVEQAKLAGEFSLLWQLRLNPKW